MDQWRSSAEQIAVSQTIQGTRLLGIIAPTGASNSSLFARMVSEAMGRSGLKVLLAELNANDPAPTAVDGEPWRPVDASSSGYIDVLAPNVTAETRHIFNNSAWLAQYFDEHRQSYSNIVVDLPPVISARDNQLMPLAAASTCDAVILMCSTGRVTHAEIETAVQLLKSVKVALIGIVVDESEGNAASRRLRRDNQSKNRLPSGAQGKNSAERLNP